MTTPTEQRVRLNVTVDPDIPAMLEELAGSSKRMGEYLNALIRNAYTGQKSTPAAGGIDVEGLRLMVLGLAGRVASVEGDVISLAARVEGRV